MGLLGVRINARATGGRKRINLDFNNAGYERGYGTEPKGHEIYKIKKLVLHDTQSCVTK